MNIIFACGGTGGHIYPAVAIYEEFLKHSKKNEHKYLFVGSDYGLENEIFKKEDITNACFIKSRGIKRSISPYNIKAAFYNVIAFFQSKKIINSFKPDIVISTGGYPAFHITYWANKKKIPFILLEGNLRLGLVNRLFYKKARKVILSNELTKKYLEDGKNIKVIGSPSRIRHLSKSKIQIYKEMNLNPNKKLVTIMGGSCGADKLNSIVIELLKNSSLEYQVIWATGKKHYKDIVSSIKNIPDWAKVVNYIDNVNEILSVTDVIVSRSGAMTIQEIKEFKLPAVLIPFEKAAENHQYINALELSNLNVANIINEKDLNVDILVKTLDVVITNKSIKQIEENYEKINIVNCNEKIYEEIIII
jgi:UDP-N-acetylglucosamine--N-acetylmuramyl-(pentapeptide) pyrophosphoryl-undecaprenol N-acetylglucosamine transferase